MNMVTAAPSVSFWPSLMIWARIVACRPPHPALPQPIAASGIVSGSCALKRITQHARSRVALNRRHRIADLTAIFSIQLDHHVEFSAALLSKRFTASCDSCRLCASLNAAVVAIIARANKSDPPLCLDPVDHLVPIRFRRNQNVGLQHSRVTDRVDKPE
ncbi:hypothetical protein GOB46_31120 [Sinorhizobium meliloti]|nr:hypothetical protein [Sinorhizobium meliloti]MDW9875506.1 hypothetical protein [Sinorhizobium meliloti]MDW9887709.1 hypothetical protein [Sinorhizobium meliloti]MDX0209931.1 hypothetical protein [Sinorhizobium meliloti]